MKKLQLILMAAWLILNCTFAFAVRVPGLYEAEVPVQDQQAGSRSDAIVEAMKLVLVKLTGDRNAPARLALSPLLETAENYVQQYRYLQSATGGPGAAAGQLMISVSFDDMNLENALRNLGIQVWSRERPSTLIWIAMEDDTTRRILQPEFDSEIFQEIQQQSRTRGIVLINPLFDLQDNSSLRASDIWGGFHFTVKNASQRYNPDLILTGKLSSPLPGIWEGLWTVYLKEEETTFATEGSYLESVLTEGINGLADRIAANFSQAYVAETSDALLMVIDILTVQQYAKVLNYLQSLSPVTDVEVTRLDTGAVEFKLTAHGGESAVTQAINFGRVLVPVSENNNMYRLSP